MGRPLGLLDFRPLERSVSGSGGFAAGWRRLLQRREETRARREGPAGELTDDRSTPTANIRFARLPDCRYHHDLANLYHRLARPTLIHSPGPAPPPRAR